MENERACDRVDPDIGRLLDRYVPSRERPHEWSDVLRVASRRARRRRVAPWIAGAVAAAAFVALVGAGLHGRDPRRAAQPPANAAEWVDPLFGLNATIPAGWRRATWTLTPGLVNPREVLSVSTGPLVRSAPGANMPDRAARALGPSGVLVSVQEWRRLSARDPLTGFGPRPASFDLADRTPISGGLEGLGDPGAGSRTWWIPFRDGDRAFYALVVAQRDARPERIDQATAILDGLRFSRPEPVTRLKDLVRGLADPADVKYLGEVALVGGGAAAADYVAPSNDRASTCTFPVGGCSPNAVIARRGMWTVDRDPSGRWNGVVLAPDGTGPVRANGVVVGDATQPIILDAIAGADLVLAVGDRTFATIPGDRGRSRVAMGVLRRPQNADDRRYLDRLAAASNGVVSGWSSLRRLSGDPSQGRRAAGGAWGQIGIFPGRGAESVCVLVHSAAFNAMGNCTAVQVINGVNAIYPLRNASDTRTIGFAAPVPDEVVSARLGSPSGALIRPTDNVVVGLYRPGQRPSVATFTFRDGRQVIQPLP